MHCNDLEVNAMVGTQGTTTRSTEEIAMPGGRLTKQERQQIALLP